MPLAAALKPSSSRRIGMSMANWGRHTRARVAKTQARLVATNDSVTAMPASDHRPAPATAMATPTIAPAAVATVDDSTKSRM